MPRIVLSALLLTLCFSAAAQAQPDSVVPPIPFHERVLANGLRVITSLDRTT